MKRIFLAVPMILMLTGCGAPSVEDLIENQDKLAEISQECNLLIAQGKSVDTEECRNAAEAQQKMAGNLLNGMMKQFGQ